MNLKEKINPKHTALIIIDIQNDFASPDTRFFRAKRGGDLSLVEPMINNLKRLIPLAEKVGVFVAYTQQIFDKSKLNDLQKEQYDLDDKLITCDINTDGYKFYQLDPPSEKIYPKYNFNIFSNDKLIKDLEQRGIKTLVITGMDIVFCVENAVRIGYDLGYKIVVPKNSVAGNAKYQDLINKTFDVIKSTFGSLVVSDEIVAIWSEYVRKPILEESKKD